MWPSEMTSISIKTPRGQRTTNPIYWLGIFPPKIRKKVQGMGIEPTTSAVLKPRHNQLDHPCVMTSGQTSYYKLFTLLVISRKRAKKEMRL